MSDFTSETHFDSEYNMNDQSQDGFRRETFLLSADAFGSKDQGNFLPVTTSPSISSTQCLQPSMSTMSHCSGMSGTSASSSALSSPFIAMHQDVESHFSDWSKPWSTGSEPGIMQNDTYPPTFLSGQLEDGDHIAGIDAEQSMAYVAPNVVQPYDLTFYQPGLVSPYDSSIATDFAAPMHPPSFPTHSPMSTRSPTHESPATSAVPSLGSAVASHGFSQNNMSRQPSIGSTESVFSKGSPRSLTGGLDEDSNERGRCPFKGCGRVFKDLRAHKLTHQPERPEKCPIEKCQYHVKGFARKYDQTRHTLTHYKGTMVCGFCPGSGSPSEKSFNRADVFKRHLTSVHGVEQTPSNSRRKPTQSTAKKVSTKDEIKEGKCSTCGSVFASAQDFYNHLDDCVMKILEKPELSESHNERHLMDVAGDQNVKATLERNNLDVEPNLMDVVGDQNVKATLERNNLAVEPNNEDMQCLEDEDEEMDDDNDDDTTGVKGQSCTQRVGKSPRGMTRSKGGVPTISKGRRKRKDYPHSWGSAKEQMKMKKRVLCVYDGQRRLWKDEMMLDNEYEVRVPYSEGNADQYVTDLDVMTMKRAKGILEATEEEKGPFLKDEEITKLML